MKIDKAIEILNLITDTPPSGVNPDFVDAVKLGKEALKLVRDGRNTFFYTFKGLLPGETKE